MLSAPAWAQTIGNAAVVRNDVAQVRGSAASPISVGEAVVRNEVVRAGADSATKLVFRDNTNLAVGPNSTVTLDRFVFQDEETATKVSVNLVKGAFRFTTGDSAKRAYEVKTPVATIGVRGTIFDVLSRNGVTTIVLEEGALTGCVKGTTQCRTISNPGDTLIITASGVRFSSTPGGPGGFSFASLCGGDGLCTATRYASVPGGLTPVAFNGGGGALCGR